MDGKADLVVSKGFQLRKSIWKGMPGYEIKGEYFIVELGLVHIIRALFVMLLFRNYKILIAKKAKRLDVDI